MYAVVKLDGFPQKKMCLTMSNDYNEILRRFEFWSTKIPVTIIKLK